MKEEEIINIITIVICAIALVPSLILIAYQIVNKRKGNDAIINYILCFCCMIESIYFFLGVDTGVIICKLKGVMLIIADIMRMSIGLIKLLLLRIENYENLGIENNKTTKDNFLIFITVIFTIIVPIAFGLLSLIWGDINYTQFGNCYPYNSGYKLFFYLLSVVYYFIFFFFLWEIVVKAKFYHEKMTMELLENTSLITSINQTQAPIINTLLYYGIVQALNFILILLFLIYLFLQRFAQDTFFIKGFVNSIVYNICSMIIQSVLFFCSSLSTVFIQ